MKYIKKPIPVEAVQISEDKNDIIENYPQWFCEAFDSGKIKPSFAFTGLVVSTLEGDMYAPWGSYIIRGVEGELYPCKKEIFKKTYEVYKEEE